MKNQIILFFAILAIAFTSCKKETVTFTEFSKKADTTIMFVHYKPILQNRVGCNDTIIPTKFVDGKPVGQKVKGWEMIEESIPVNVSVNVTADDMKNHMVVGKKPTPDNSSSSNGSFWNGFGKVLPWLLALLVLGLILWLLSMLPWFGNRDSNVNHTHTYHHNYPQPQAPAPPVQKEVREDRIFVIGGLGLPAESLFRGQVQNHNGVQNIFNVHGNGNHVTISTNYPIEPKKEEPKQPV